MNALDKALTKPLPKEVMGLAVDAVTLETLETRMQGFRARLYPGQSLTEEEVATIVTYQRLVRQKAFQDTNVIKKPKARATNMEKKVKARATKKQQSLSEDDFFATFEGKNE